MRALAIAQHLGALFAIASIVACGETDLPGDKVSRGRVFSDFRWDGGASDAQECPLYDCLAAVVATCPLPMTTRCTKNLSAQESVTCLEMGMKIVLTPIPEGVLTAIKNADGSTCCN